MGVGAVIVGDGTSVGFEGTTVVEGAMVVIDGTTVVEDSDVAGGSPVEGTADRGAPASEQATNARAPTVTNTTRRTYITDHLYLHHTTAREGLNRAEPPDSGARSQPPSPKLAFGAARP